MKTPKASGALRWAPDPMPRYACFTHLTPLCYVGKIGQTRAGPPLTKSWICYCSPPFMSNQWIHSVIFELLAKVKLTRSSYQITTFLDCHPFIEGFEKVDDYIEQFAQDLDNPEYVDRILKRVENIESMFGLNKNL